MIFKKCNACLKNKPINLFHKRGEVEKKSQYRHICKKCMNEISIKRVKLWRHKKGISKKYRGEYQIGKGISQTKEYRQKYRIKNRKRINMKNKLWKQTMKGRLSQKIHNFIHRTRTKDLTLQTIQQIYGDNIKQYGTLTCYLCYETISFGDDSIDHKTPLSRGGDSRYENLGVAHFRCNCKKHNKTEKEYRKEIGGVV